jgi:hypothetical protein
MGIPSKQIGWSTKSNLLWQISKQLEQLINIIGTSTISPSGTYIVTESNNAIMTEGGDNLIIE